MNFQIIPVGEQALNLVFPEKIDVQENRLIHQIAEQLKMADWPTIIDLIPAYHTLTINYNVEKTDFEKISQDLKAFINSLNFNENSSQKQRVVEIPVCYGDKFGPDLMTVAEFAQMSPAEVVKMHTSQPYYVYFLGFLPGFAYAGFVPDKIAMPRLQQPRLQLAAGSVGIAGKQTGMYPVASPGGWRIIGQTPLRLYDPKNPLPPYHAGDWLQFNSVSSDEFYQIQQAADSGKYSIKTHFLMTTAATRGAK
ncbi:MAG: 5-oxoprolinase subunit PxpB [Liquorilactobacillus nagelii]|uniref:5-oxoprolinase subunit PxpB n=1 Tax=Liquorilactobacillus nagelii TaxID=82688 RepID=UPI0039E9EBEA